VEDVIVVDNGFPFMFYIRQNPFMHLMWISFKMFIPTIMIKTTF